MIEDFDFYSHDQTTWTYNPNTSGVSAYTYFKHDLRRLTINSLTFYAKASDTQGSANLEIYCNSEQSLENATLLYTSTHTVAQDADNWQTITVDDINAEVEYDTPYIIVRVNTVNAGVAISQYPTVYPVHKHLLYDNVGMQKAVSLNVYYKMYEFAGNEDKTTWVYEAGTWSNYSYTQYRHFFKRFTLHRIIAYVKANDNPDVQHTCNVRILLGTGNTSTDRVLFNDNLTITKSGWQPLEIDMEDIEITYGTPVITVWVATTNAGVAISTYNDKANQGYMKYDNSGYNKVVYFDTTSQIEDWYMDTDGYPVTIPCIVNCHPFEGFDNPYGILDVWKIDSNNEGYPWTFGWDAPSPISSGWYIKLSDGTFAPLTWYIKLSDGTFAPLLMTIKT